VLLKEFCNEQFEVQVAMHQCRILFYMGRGMECVTRGLEALSLFEPRLPGFVSNPIGVASYESELLKSIIEITKDSGIAESFGKLPALIDKFLLAAHSLIIEMIAPLAWGAPHLLNTLPLLGVLLTFKHGKCIQSAFHVPAISGSPNRQMSMLAFDVSNPDRPNADRGIAQVAVELALETLKSLGGSHLFNCRIWTVLGMLCY
jgi:hypothetical protein